MKITGMKADRMKADRFVMDEWIGAEESAAVTIGDFHMSGTDWMRMEEDEEERASLKRAEAALKEKVGKEIEASLRHHAERITASTKSLYLNDTHFAVRQKVDSLAAISAKDGAELEWLIQHQIEEAIKYRMDKEFSGCVGCPRVCRNITKNQDEVTGEISYDAVVNCEGYGRACERQSTSIAEAMREASFSPRLEPEESLDEIADEALKEEHQATYGSW